ncbi:hydantoinase/oxoprolinase family protein (plasmid) [Rhodococcus sp. USK10]|uniref:hydantoinase/oxoprolinase family protein n=1 Tax=Rhodococcus sp. USK10 TaxID=2789739 RepID=UPI001C5D7434|nr:hydantoinase/oxoprolinase family protein [Rhodococcus sp. USK10]QYB00116.1 hydantoinase/oxoprolinase family protein [Rhodococcus sp. USK10]
MSARRVRVAVDVGGTFTDICVFDDETGHKQVEKVPSSVDPIEAVLAGVAKAGVDLHDVALFSHGTTVATNALITRRLPRAVMITTKGFRDIIEIRRGNKEDLWDAYKDVAPPYIRRRDRLEVDERVDYAGQVLEPLDEDAARRVVDVVRRKGVTTVAVCFINAYANPANERRMAEILAEELPDVRVTTSSDVLPEIFEHERFSTTVANAVLAPLVSGYVNRLGSDLKVGGYEADLLILHSGGGVMTPKTVEKLGVRLAASGIAAGAIANRHIATLSGHPNAIGLDMGGTSTDISLVVDGVLRTTKEWQVEYGYPICLPSIEVLTIGAGGGSLAWFDEAGALRNGPHSAGATPGPAAYGKGGTKPTNTDANLVLGRLGGKLINGGMTLDAEAAEEAIREHAAEPLGVSVQEAAESILRVANANMADAVRLISIRRGYDPREFALVVFGGAGPLHGVDLARELSIPTVLVPPNPGITSALGCLLVDIQHDLSTMFLGRVDTVSPQDVEAEFRNLEAEARERLSSENVAAEDMQLIRTIDMRYLGQWRSIAVPVGSTIDSLDDVAAAFHLEHAREHNFRRDSTPVEVYRLNVTAIGSVPKPNLPEYEVVPSTPNPQSYRPVWFAEQNGAVDTPVYDRDTLTAGAVIEGPAIVEQLDSTTPIPPGVTAEVDAWLNLRITV